MQIKKYYNTINESEVEENVKPNLDPNERMKHNLDWHKRNWLMKCIRSKKYPIMENWDLMKEIGKWSSLIRFTPEP